MASYSIEEFQTRVSNLPFILSTELLRINETVATTAYGQLKERIKQFGEDSKGKRFGTYSDKYEKRRDRFGLETNFVNLSFTDQMFKDIGVVSSEAKGNTIITVVTAKDTIQRGKVKTSEIMEFNAERYGDFMALNEEEEKEMALTFDDELQQVLDNVFE